MPTTSEALPAHLVHLCTLVLVSRASASASAAASSSQQTAPVGFTHARQQPLDALAHLLHEYLGLVAATAAQAANHAGRTNPAVWDVAHALAHCGFPGEAGIQELTDEALRGHDGVHEEADQIAQLAKGLQDRLAPQPAQLPLCQLVYDPLQPPELELLALAQSLPDHDDAPTPSGSSATSSVSDDELASPPPHQSAHPAPVPPKLETHDAGLNGFGSLDDLGGLLGAAGADDAAFFDSLGLGGPLSSGVNGIGDLTASVFQPLDLAGRPIADLSLLGPADLASLPMFPTGAEGAAPPPEDETRPFPAWRDPSAVPAHIPPFFPPFPGHERESDSAAARRRRRAQAEQRERDALAAQTGPGAAGTGVSRAAAALMLGGGAGGDPWDEAIPYSASSLATMASEFGHSLPTPSSPRSAARDKARADKDGADEAAREKKRRRVAAGRRRSLSPPPTASTSLASFAQIQPLIPHQPTYLRTNPLRRSAAGHIAYIPRHPELSISSDSLFGSLPYVNPLRQTTLPPGFLPDLAPTAALHPFNTNLPWTISNPVPYHPATTSSLLPAPPPNPRVPTPLSAIARELSFPLQFDPRPAHRDQLHPNIALFARLRRIGPPGPLGPKGEALNYEYIGNTALLALAGVDWPERRHDRKLPKRFGEDDTFGAGTGAGGASGGGGIKLKLGGGTAKDAAFGAAAGGRQTREGSLAAIATPWNTFGSPAPALGGAGGATPFTGATPGGSAFVGGSTGDAELDTQLAQLSAALPPPSQSQPQMDFDYPEWLLEAGALPTSAAPPASVAAAAVAGAPVPAFEWSEPPQPVQPAPTSLQGQAEPVQPAPTSLPGQAEPVPMETEQQDLAPPGPSSTSELPLDPALSTLSSTALPPPAHMTAASEPPAALDAALADVGHAAASAAALSGHAASEPPPAAAGAGTGADEHEVDVESAVQKGIEAALFGGLSGLAGLAGFEGAGAGEGGP
ncbi:hypothetical protein JCM3770_000522 [Rhodotorula araucariae]